MPTTTVNNNDLNSLQEIADMVCRANQILVVTGAGISTNSGIPDFRSKNGLYNLVKEKYPNYPTLLKGRDMFDSILFTDPALTSIFFTFLTEFRDRVETIDNTTPTHKFIKTLSDTGRLLRCYTQNIDGLEALDGLCMDVTRGVGKRGKGKERVGRDAGCEVVQLHGDLNQLRCTLCGLLVDYTDERKEFLSVGEPPDCPDCSSKSNERVEAGKRSIAVGTLRPNIVLYNEPHPRGEDIGRLTHHDATKANPDLMLIFGTSLKVIGLKRLVKAFAQKIHDRGGKVIYINNNAAADSVWGHILDYHVQMDCDDWIKDLKVKGKDAWEMQKPSLRRRKTIGVGIGSDSDKENSGKPKANRRKSTSALPKRQLPTPTTSPLKSKGSRGLKRTSEELPVTPSKRQRTLGTIGSIIKVKSPSNPISVYDETHARRTITSSPLSAFTQAPSDLLSPTPWKQKIMRYMPGFPFFTLDPPGYIEAGGFPSTPTNLRTETVSSYIISDLVPSTPKRLSASDMTDGDFPFMFYSPRHQRFISKPGSPSRRLVAAEMLPTRPDFGITEPETPVRPTKYIEQLSPSPIYQTARSSPVTAVLSAMTPSRPSPWVSTTTPMGTPKGTPSKIRDKNGFYTGSRSRRTERANRVIEASVSPPPKPDFSRAGSSSSTLTFDNIRVASLVNEETNDQLLTPPCSQSTPSTPMKSRPQQLVAVVIDSPKKHNTTSEVKSERCPTEEVSESSFYSMSNSSKSSLSNATTGTPFQIVTRSAARKSLSNIPAAQSTPVIKRSSSRSSLPETIGRQPTSSIRRSSSRLSHSNTPASQPTPNNPRSSSRLSQSDTPATQPTPTSTRPLSRRKSTNDITIGARSPSKPDLFEKTSPVKTRSVVRTRAFEVKWNSKIIHTRSDYRNLPPGKFLDNALL